MQAFHPVGVFAFSIGSAILRYENSKSYLMSTEQTADFSLHEQFGQKWEQLQKGALNPPEIQRQNGHGSAVGDRFPQFGHNQTQPAFAFGKTEPPFNFHALAVINEVLRNVSERVFLWPAQCWAGQSNSMLLAIAVVLPVAVDFVRQNSAGIMPLPLPESLRHGLQISCFIVGVKGDALQAAPTICNTDVKLGSEFYRIADFSVDIT